MSVVSLYLLHTCSQRSVRNVENTVKKTKGISGADHLFRSSTHIMLDLSNKQTMIRGFFFPVLCRYLEHKPLRCSMTNKLTGQKRVMTNVWYSIDFKCEIKFLMANYPCTRLILYVFFLLFVKTTIKDVNSRGVAATHVCFDLIQQQDGVE